MTDFTSDRRPSGISTFSLATTTFHKVSNVHSLKYRHVEPRLASEPEPLMTSPLPVLSPVGWHRTALPIMAMISGGSAVSLHGGSKGGVSGWEDGADAWRADIINGSVELGRAENAD